MALTLKSKIALLRYPRIDNLSFTDPAEVAAFVAFIEDRHVRTWEIEQRACLRKPGPAWLASFEEYLRVRMCCRALLHETSEGLAARTDTLAHMLFALLLTRAFSRISAARC